MSFFQHLYQQCTLSTSNLLTEQHVLHAQVVQSCVYQYTVNMDIPAEGMTQDVTSHIRVISLLFRILPPIVKEPIDSTLSMYLSECAYIKSWHYLVMNLSFLFLYEAFF